MKCRLIALMLVLSLPLTGCASLLERDYVIVSPYKPVSASPEDSSALRVGNYQELVNAILYLVTLGEEQGVLNLYNYTQDVESDLTRACLEVIQEDPLGAYSVDYISHNYSMIVSYYEVNLQITYRRTREQVAAIAQVTGSSAIRRMIGQALTSFAPETVLQVSYFTEDEAYIRELVEQTYYESPITALGMPETQVRIYPDSGSQRIVEILLTYPDDSDTLLRRSRELTGRALVLVSEESTAQTLCDQVRGSLTVSGAPDKGSAYDALIRHEANDEGIALAYQLLCDQAGISCYLVRGTRGGIPHFWNIVQTEEGNYRHMDLSEDLYGMTDEDFTAALYAWDSEKYPACPAPPPVDEPVEDDVVDEGAETEEI